MKKLVKENRAPLARIDAENRLQKLTNLFDFDTLNSFGLSRDAATFDDIMRGGAESEKQLEKTLESELPLTSKLDVIKFQARAQYNETKNKFQKFVFDIKSTCAAHGVNDLDFMPEYVRLNEQGEVELTPEGTDALDMKVNLYLTTEKQVAIYDAAITVKDAISNLQKLVSKYGFNAFGTRGIMEIGLQESTIDVDLLSVFDYTIKELA